MQSDLQDLQEKLFNHFETHVLKYHVSLGSYLDLSELPSPFGSGTFVKFSIPSHTIYGILTAAHVIIDLKFGLVGQSAFVGLSKLHNGEKLPDCFIFLYLLLR